MAKQHGPWQIQSGEIKYRNARLVLREDQVIQPDGKDGIFATVTISKGVAVLPLDEVGTVSLVRQFRYAIGRDSVETVSGAIEEEETPLQAAQREAREELGIEAAEWVPLGVVDPLTGNLSGPAHLFLARGLTQGEPQREGSEELEVLRVSLEEAVRMVMASEITHSVSCVLILKAWLLLNEGKSTDAG